MNNLGVLPILTQPVTVPTPTPAPSIPWYQKIGDTLNPLLDVANKVVDTVQNVQNDQRYTTTTQQQLQQQQAMLQQQQSGISPAVKIGLGIAAAAVLGFIAVKAFGKSKPKKAMGELNTAKTKAGRERQRKAVFARLAAEGSVKPKSKKRKKAGRTKKVML